MKEREEKERKLKANKIKRERQCWKQKKRRKVEEKGEWK